MRTAFKFHPRQGPRNSAKVEAITGFFEWCCDMAYAADKEVKVLMQHDLKKEVFIVTAELPKKTFSARSEDPIKALKRVSTDIFRWIEKKRKKDAAREEKERVAREENS